MHFTPYGNVGGSNGNEKGRELILRLGWFELNSYSFILNNLILFHLSQICTSAGQANSVNCTEWVVRDLNPISILMTIKFSGLARLGYSDLQFAEWVVRQVKYTFHYIIITYVLDHQMELSSNLFDPNSSK